MTNFSPPTPAIRWWPGLAAHSLFDGVAIASGFVLSSWLGWIIFVAILLHKLPEGFTVASVMLASGHSRVAALNSAVIVASATLAGVLVINFFPGWVRAGLPVAAGVAIYVSATDLVPEVNREPGIRMALVFFGGVAGFLVCKLLPTVFSAKADWGWLQAIPSAKNDRDLRCQSVPQRLYAIMSHLDVPLLAQQDLPQRQGKILAGQRFLIDLLGFILTLLGGGQQRVVPASQPGLQLAPRAMHFTRGGTRHLHVLDPEVMQFILEFGCEPGAYQRFFTKQLARFGVLQVLFQFNKPLVPIA